MTFLRTVRILWLIATLVIAQAAHANCFSNGSDFIAGVCHAQDFAQTNAGMEQSIQKLSDTLAPAAQHNLAQSQATWFSLRAKTCEKPGANGTFIDFNCATQMNLARLATLKLKAAYPVVPLKYNGLYVVQSTAMPWIWVKNGLNAAFPFGKQDGTGPTLLTLDGLSTAPGQSLILRYVSGQISTSNSAVPSDASGVASAYDYGGPGASGALLPNAYMHPYPVHLGELVGAFENDTGQIIGGPLALGDGPDLLPIPPGAAQIELGFNIDQPAISAGHLVISVMPAPPGPAPALAQGTHGCAVFGGDGGAACQDYPKWTSGLWMPPPGTGTLRILLVGGGGGGAANNFYAGTGGTGGGSGAVVETSMPIPNGPIMVRAGRGGAGAKALSAPGGTGGISSFGPLTATGGGGGTARMGGDLAGTGGSSGGGGGGAGTFETGFDAGAGGAGGIGGSTGTGGEPPSDVEDGENPIEGGNGTPFPAFTFTRSQLTPGPGGIGGSFGSGGLTPFAVACPGGGGGGGGGGGVLLNGNGPAGKQAYYVLVPHPCGQPGGNGQGGFGYGAGGGGSGAGIADQAGNGAAGMVYVEW